MFDLYNSIRSPPNIQNDPFYDSDDDIIENEDLVLMPYKAMCSEKLYKWFEDIRK